MEFNYFVIGLFFASISVACAAGVNNYLWGDISPSDYLIAKDAVKKSFFMGLEVTEKYVFKQKNNLNALTITAIKVIDKRKANGATAELLTGGPGSKGATIKFKSQRGYGINDVVEIYGC